MIGLKKFLNTVFLFLFDIILLAIGVIKQIVLPNRRRKGNILNSILVFFIGLVEILNHFEYGIFQMSKVLKHRYVRQGLIITTAFLFLLSSFEWTNEKEINRTSLNASVIEHPQKVLEGIPFNKAKRATYWLKKTSLALNHSVNICRLPVNFLDSTPVKRYLFIRSILI